MIKISEGKNKAWIFTSKPVLRPDEYRECYRACPTGKVGLPD